jgi:hypothetical protein
LIDEKESNSNLSEKIDTNSCHESASIPLKISILDDTFNAENIPSEVSIEDRSLLGTDTKWTEKIQELNEYKRINGSLNLLRVSVHTVQ